MGQLGAGPAIMTREPVDIRHLTVRLVRQYLELGLVFRGHRVLAGRQSHISTLLGDNLGETRRPYVKCPSMNPLLGHSACLYKAVSASEHLALILTFTEKALSPESSPP